MQLVYLDNMAAHSNDSLSLPSDYLIRVAVNQYMKQVNFIIMFVQLFVLFIGLFGNLLALIVINRKSMRNTSSSVFITWMAILDSAVLLLHAAKLIQPRRNLFIHCSLTYLIDLVTFCANWVLVIITLGNGNLISNETEVSYEFHIVFRALHCCGISLLCQTFLYGSFCTSFSLHSICRSVSNFLNYISNFLPYGRSFQSEKMSHTFSFCLNSSCFSTDFVLCTSRHSSPLEFLYDLRINSTTRGTKETFFNQ